MRMGGRRNDGRGGWIGKEGGEGGGRLLGTPMLREGARGW